MNLDQLKTELLAAARSTPPDERVPYGFEKRVMARLAAHEALDGCALWARALWKAAAPCVTVMMLLCIWSLFAGVGKPHLNSQSAASVTGDVAQELENTLLAAADQEQPPEILW